MGSMKRSSTVCVCSVYRPRVNKFLILFVCEAANEWEMNWRENIKIDNENLSRGMIAHRSYSRAAISNWEIGFPFLSFPISPSSSSTEKYNLFLFTKNISHSSSIGSTLDWSGMTTTTTKMTTKGVQSKSISININGEDYDGRSFLLLFI